MTIAETSKKYGLTADTLRYYERIGLIPPVPRTKGGVRDFDEASCRWIELVKCMRSAGVQIEALIEYGALCRQGEGTEERRKDILVEPRALRRGRMGKKQPYRERLGDNKANKDKLLREK